MSHISNPETDVWMRKARRKVEKHCPDTHSTSSIAGKMSPASAVGKTVCVTGAGGFIASWIVLKLLQRGYNVRGTVRDPDNDSKYGHLKKLEGAKERLTLFKADVLDYNSLVLAIRGCDGVFHTACPVAMQFDNADDVLHPAIKGTENVLKICREERIKRVVMTSSGAAMVADPNRPEDKVVDESCWSDTTYCRENKHWYMLAKTESEKVAWEFAKQHNLDLVVICPVFVFGPLLQSTLNTTTDYLKKLADGSSGSYSNMYTSVVDVRDVAEAHILAFENPAASGRYCCLERTVHFKDIVDTLKKNFPQFPYPEMCDGEKAQGIPPGKVSNKKVRDLIKEFTPFEQTLVDTIKSLQERGFLAK